jgi:hypothetical protein
VSYTLTGHIQFLGAAISLLFFAVFCMTSTRLFCSRYYQYLCAVWSTLMFVVETVSVNLTGGDQLTGCHALVCACNNAHLTRM